MRIVFCVTNDLITDRRIERIGMSLKKIHADVFLVGVRFGRSLPVGETGFLTHRFRMLFRKGPLFYMEYNIRLFFFLLFLQTDIIVANDLDTLLAAYLASVIKRRPIVYDSHEYFTELPELVDRPAIKRIWGHIEELILPKIKYAYTVSPSIAGRYNEKYGISMKVIRNLPARSLKSPGETHFKKAGEKWIIYQGALNKGRGLELAIRAMQYMTDCCLLIAGTGYLEKKLIRLAKSTGVYEKVRFLGLLRSSALLKYTAQADLGISLEENTGLNYYYALPNKLFDYIQAQIPVLVSNLPEMASVVKTYDVGRVLQTADPEELAGIFNQMLTDEKLRNRWKENLKNASAELCWENEEEKVLAIYRGLIKDRVSAITDK